MLVSLPNNLLPFVFDPTDSTLEIHSQVVHPLGLHHLGDLCLIRHLCPDHRLKTKVRVRTLIPWFHRNQPLQGRLLLSQNLMIFMPLRHLPQDLLLRMLWTPHMDSLILTQIPSMIRSRSFGRIGMIHLLHHGLDIII